MIGVNSLDFTVSFSFLKEPIQISQPDPESPPAIVIQDGTPSPTGPPNSPKMVRSEKRKLPLPIQLVSPVNQLLYYISGGPKVTEPKTLFPQDAGFDFRHQKK